MRDPTRNVPAEQYSPIYDGKNGYEFEVREELCCTNTDFGGPSYEERCSEPEPEAVAMIE